MLLAFGEEVRNCWVDVFTDSQVLLKAWQRQVARSHGFASALKKVFSAMMRFNLDLHLFFIPSEANVADAPSRRLCMQDSKLCSDLWESVQRQFGGDRGHTVDLMALPSNTQTDLEGRPLPFFSPFVVPHCAGVNMFAQAPQPATSQLFENPYVFPPICLIPQVFLYLGSLRISFTMVVPDVVPRRYWWPLLCSTCRDRVLLAPAGSVGSLLIPSKEGYRDDWMLPWDLWAFRVLPE